MVSRVIVTGATGFLARHTLPLFHGEVIACARHRDAWSSEPWTSAVEARVVETSLSCLEETFCDVDRARAVVHLAALVQHSRRAARLVYETNVEGALHAVRLAAHLRARLIFASTSGTVGCFTDERSSADEHAPFCESTVRRWPYYHSKILAERRVQELADTLGVDLVIVRLPILLGPDDHRGRSTSHVRRFVEGRLPLRDPGGRCS